VDVGILLASIAIGFVVGLTGVGGGALTTPVLMLFFGVPPLTAVSSDLISAAITKPFGSVVHWRAGTVHWRIVLWLVVGSVPAALAGAVLLNVVGPIGAVQTVVKTALGVALILAAAGMIARAYLALRARTRLDGRPVVVQDDVVTVRPGRTLLVGVFGGLIVGLTSVGAGSLMMLALMALYPRLSPRRLVGTDLAQSVPLAISAALGHLFFGEVDWLVVWAVVIGSIPGMLAGALLSTRLPSGILRRALAVILFASALKTLGVDNLWTLLSIAVALVAGTVAWMLARRAHGLPYFWWQERRASARAAAGPAAARETGTG